MDLAARFFRERSVSKVAAVYIHGEAAEAAAQRLRVRPDMNARQVQLIVPHDSDWPSKVEPEGIGFLRTAIRSYAVCGALGFAFGVAVFAMLYYAGVEPVLRSPGSALMAFTLFSTAVALILSGLLTLRPDHELVIAPVRDATRDGHWAIVVHPVSREQRRHAAFVLRATGGRIPEMPDAR